MKKTLKFYSIWEDGYWSGTMTALLQGYGFIPVDSPMEADVLVFNGGADIATEIYGELPVFLGIPQFKTQRDKREIELYSEFVGQKFMLGICRGAQLLNCLNGGTLWQHVNNHGRDHKMVDLTTMETMNVTSTHHQMMRPNPNGSGQIIGVSSESTHKDAQHKSDKCRPEVDAKFGKDIEVVWYPETKCLLIQGHPEYVPGSRFADWSVDLLKDKYKKSPLTCAA